MIINSAAILRVNLSARVRYQKTSDRCLEENHAIFRITADACNRTDR